MPSPPAHDSGCNASTHDQWRSQQKTRQRRVPGLHGSQSGNGGLGRNRTGVRGFAVRCMTTLPPGHCFDKCDRMIAVVLKKQNPGKPRFCVETGAGNETRTRDPDLGKVVLYQLSYSRIGAVNHTRMNSLVNRLGGKFGKGFHPVRKRRGPEHVGASSSNWSGKRDSNSRPRPWQGRALPTELFPHEVVN